MENLLKEVIDNRIKNNLKAILNLKDRQIKAYEYYTKVLEETNEEIDKKKTRIKELQKQFNEVKGEI